MTVEELVLLIIIYEVYDRDMDYKVGGRRREPW